MESGHYHLQIAISVVMILGASVVAFICDFLKRNNEQLRELNIELKIRHEVERRRAEVRTAQPSPAVATPPAEKPVIEKRPGAARSRSMAVPAEGKRPLAPEALAAMERGARLAAAGPRAKIPAVAKTPQPAVAPAPKLESPKPAATQPAASISATEKPTVGKRDWSALLAKRTPGPAAPEVRSTLDVPTAPVGIPAGYHEGYILSQLVQKRQPVTGLVVSIGVTAPRQAHGSLPEDVLKLVQSLIGADDFACQSSEEEFLLVYPKERGASAQRRLNQIAQQLWDFQLSSTGTSSILFSWGGLEVRSESIDEAIASANQRMQETKRGRKLLPMASRPDEAALRQAV